MTSLVQAVRMVSMLVEVPSALPGTGCRAIDRKDIVAARAAIAVLINAKG